MKRIAVMFALLIAAVGVLWLFPLFHIVRTDELQAARQRTAFDASTFAQSFWTERLTPSLAEAADAAELVAAFRQDPQLAREKFGRKVGVGRTRLFVLRGSGTISAVEAKGVQVSLQNEGEPDIQLRTGLLFGNTIRDASGLLDASDFANSQHFNNISTELNRIVEASVITKLKEQAAPGRKIQFVGCAELADGAGEVLPLRVIPLDVQID
jgi:predicted lipoprotein